MGDLSDDLAVRKVGELVPATVVYGRLERDLVVCCS